MSQSSATGLLPSLQVHQRRTEAERGAFETLACEAYRFGSPVVVDQNQLAIWVEVERSLSLFGGWRKLAQGLLAPVEHCPYELRLGVAPTLSAAYLMARISEKPRRPVVRLTDLPAALAALPLQALPFDGDSIDTLHGAGLRRIGEVLAIPTSTLGKRVGKTNLLALNRLLGKVPEVWDAWQPATRYRRHWDFDHGIETTDGLLFPLRIVMAEFVAYLKVRDLSIQKFQLRLIDSRKRTVVHPVGLLSATRDVNRLLRVLREQLDRLQLEDAVMSVTVEADRFEPAAAIQDDLFSDAGAQLGEKLTELRERLSARLGPAAVRQLIVSPDQRPQAAQGMAGSGPCVKGLDHPDRPLWLLSQPQRSNLRRILSPPERLELGWWDDREPALKRDYVVAEDALGRLCWAYREPGRADWQIHGLWQ